VKVPLFLRSAARSPLGLCLIALALAGTIGAPSVAHAKSAASSGAKQPIAIGAINGPHGSQIRGRVMKVLRDSGSYDVTDAADAKPGASADSYKKLAKGVGAEAVIVGNVSTSMNLTLTVYGTNGAKIDSIQIKGGSTQKLQKAVDNELEIAAADPLERAHKGGGGAAAGAGAGAAAASASASDDEEEAPAGSDSEDASNDEAAGSDSSSSSDAASSADAGGESTKGIRPFEFSVGIRGYHRDLKYTGLTSGYLPPYSITAPTILAEARLYPGAFFSNATFSNLGITGRYEYGIATTAAIPGANGQTAKTLNTHVYEYRFGLRGRIPIGRHEFGIFGEYGSQSFALVGDENPNQQPYAVVPDVHYNYLRFGLDARFRISKFMVGASVAPRFLTSMKELDKGGVWFPGATGSGLDFGMMLGWQLLPWFAPTVGMDYVRYGFDFNNLPAKPPPRVIAGGATDTYLSGWFALLFTLGGDSGGATAAVEASSSASTSSDTSSDSEKPATKSESNDKADDEEDEAPPAKASGKAKPAAGQPIEEEEEE
jgi:hypothetical protein